MVYSNLNSSIFYKENPGINLNDIGHESIFYEIELFGIWVDITLGKLNTIYADKNVLFYPIYLVIGNKLMNQIGLFEISAEKSTKMVDDEGDVTVELFDDPILYGFVNEEYIQKVSKKTANIPTREKLEEPEVLPQKKEPEKIEEEEDKVVKVKLPSHKQSEQLETADKNLTDGIFETDEKIIPPKMLEEETMEQADEMKKQFRENKHNVWIAKFMKNNYFGIHEVEANGDCFFAVVRDAFKQIGKITTVSKLRSLLAKEVTEDIFQQHREIFLMIDSNIKEYEKEMKDITKLLLELNNRLKTSQDKQETQKTQSDILTSKNKYKELQEDIRELKNILDESLGKFSSIRTLEEFRKHIMTSSFWVDAWSIGVMERLLNFKIIILSERSYNEQSFDSVVDCGEVDKKIQESGVFRPDFYIMTTFSGNHYKLITYKDKRIFKLHEVPFFIKNLVINKCLEKNSGPFYVIPDFRDLVKTKYGRTEEDLIDLTEEKEDDILNSELYDNSTIISFYAKAPKSMKPGKAVNIGEKIKNINITKYKTLSKYSDWRRKLDDEWIAQFTLDGHKWASVEHYYQGSKYKNGFPDFYLQFSLDSDSEISKSVSLAKDATSTTGKKKGVILRPKNVVIDSNFYAERSASTREEALLSKFQQNEDLKQLLLSTNDSKLIHFIRGKAADPDIILMKIRSKLQKPNHLGLSRE
jgi:predicted NAD-dependent protein-ADP-ribosyltransferase YbiA (DUF1768 family)